MGNPKLIRLAALGMVFIPFGCAPQTGLSEEPAATLVKAPVKFPLEFQIVDPDSPKNKTLKPGEKKLPPLIVMFPGGKTTDQTDASRPIGRLEGFRGKSKLLPESNDNPGLPVVLSGLRFHERKDDDGKFEAYEVELQGEFNAVKVPASKEAMEDLLVGKRVEFELESRLDYGIIATTSKTKLDLQLAGGRILIYAVEGDFTFREGFYTYKSPTLKTAPPKGREYLYYGVSGTLPAMRIL